MCGQYDIGNVIEVGNYHSGISGIVHAFKLRIELESLVDPSSGRRKISHCSCGQRDVIFFYFFLQ